MAADPETSDFERLQKRSRIQRIHEALTQRDWMGILIELVVVALGVLLAFRVEQWGQQRNRAAQEHEFLERMYRENARSIRELRDAYTAHHATVEQLATVIRGRDDGPLLRRLAKTRDYGCWLLRMPAVSYNYTASEELIGTGRLDLISDPNLREQLRQLAALQTESAQQLELSRQVNQLFTPYLHEKESLSLGASPMPTCYMDWPSVVRDRGSYNAIVRTYRSHYLMEQSRKSVLDQAMRVQITLACALKKPGCSGQSRPLSAQR